MQEGFEWEWGRAWGRAWEDGVNVGFWEKKEDLGLGVEVDIWVFMG